MNTYDFELTDEVLGKINSFTRKPLTKERVYAFPIVLCDNETDRDGERFSESALEKLATLFVGKTGIFDHDPKGRNQTARIFDAFTDRPEGRLTSDGRQYVCLVARAYMVTTQANASLIAEIDAGIKKEVSISCSVGKKICSICGRDIYKDPCSHIKGREYGGKSCYITLEDPRDAYEWSFVAVPAQVSAGVTKTFGKAAPAQPELPQTAQLKDEHYDMLTLLKARIKALYEYAGDKAPCCKAIIDTLPVAELIRLEKTLSAALTSPVKPQLEKAAADNNKYKTNKLG
ncbi:MAG: hypothetical protein K6F91_02195 [Ruminococcus sp.]|nr:hypothetical protein [Ruminococcus sp.]